ncbi:MAG: peptidoglycan/LPS O-acetylase OafA/YrhL [Paracoccaceae bacterium]|jgi:peptidoglycan/LPS O-acetylase OafA/YrhL
MMRNGGIDASRLICAFGIAWFHSGAPGARVAYLALPFFLVLLAMPSGAGMAQRATRLLRPWVVWSAIYAAVNTAMALRNGLDPLSWAKPEMVLYGPLIALWFLPFAALLGFALRGLDGHPNAALIAPIVGAVAVALFPANAMPPLNQWAFGLVPVVAGAAFFGRSGRGRGAAFVSLGLAFAVLHVVRPHSDNITILAGTAAAMTLFMVPIPASRSTAWAARMSFSIYLIHPLVLIAGHTLNLHGVALGVAVIAGSFAYAVALDAAGGPLRRLLT